MRKEDYVEFWKTQRTAAITAMFDNVNDYGIYPTSTFFISIDSSFETALTEYAKQCVRETLIDINERLMENEGVNFGRDFPDKYIAQKFPK